VTRELSVFVRFRAPLHWSGILRGAGVVFFAIGLMLFQLPLCRRQRSTKGMPIV
jgi:hypothetical protein